MGAVQAIEDGYVLGRAFAESSGVEEAFNRYDNAWRDRTTRVVLGSAENARRFHNPVLADPAGPRPTWTASGPRNACGSATTGCSAIKSTTCWCDDQHMKECLP